MKEINDINSVVEAYFKKNPTVKIIPVKELMPEFIDAGIFKKDVKNGKPIRDILRTLYKTDQMQLVPFLHTEHKDENIYWYFIPKDAPKPTIFYKQESISAKKEEAIKLRLLSDETYVIDLCDTALGLKAERQKRFDFLLGDLHKDGITKTKLPVDAYYESLNLVIEYKEFQHTEKSEPYIRTISGVSRDVQRQIYDQRRADELPKFGITLIEISYDIFNCDSQNKMIRNPEQDLNKIKGILNKDHSEIED